MTRRLFFAIATVAWLPVAYATHVTQPLLKQGRWTVHYVPFCIHENTSSNGYIGRCVQASDDVTVNDIKRAILEAAQIWNRYGLADVELYYTGSCGTLAWPADDPNLPGDGFTTPFTDVGDADTTSEIGCSIDVDSSSTGQAFAARTDTDGDGTANGDTITEFSIFLNANQNWTRDLTATGVGTLVDRTLTHEFGHTLGLRHCWCPGGGSTCCAAGTCNDASIMCTSSNANIFLLYSDTKVLVDDSVHDTGEDAQGWNDDHWMAAWRQANGGSTWDYRSTAWGEFSAKSLLAPAIGTYLTTSNYLVGWSAPADEGCLRTANGNGTYDSWTASTYHGLACSYHSFAIAKDSGKWVVAWREPGSATDVNRDIGTRYWNGTSWSSPVYLNVNVDAWSAPAVAYDFDSDRFIVGWVHSGVSDGLTNSTWQLPRFRTSDASTNLTSWTAAVNIWADLDGDGIVDAGSSSTANTVEPIVPWDSFDIDCRTTGDCEAAYVETNNVRQLRSFRISVASNGTITYVAGSQQNVDATGYPYSAGTAYAINGTSDERRAIGLRANLTGYNTYNYPVFKQLKKTGASGAWGSAEFFSTRESFDRCGLTYNSGNAEWMMVELDGQ